MKAELRRAEFDVRRWTGRARNYRGGGGGGGGGGEEESGTVTVRAKQWLRRAELP
jgi:hypothetical protein